MDAATNEVLETIKVDGVVHNVQVSPDGKMLGITVVPGHGEHSTDSSSNNSEELSSHGSDEETDGHSSHGSNEETVEHSSHGSVNC